VDIASAVITLILIMDPLGNIPLFLHILKNVPETRRRLVLMREIAFAYGVLVLCLFLGGPALALLGLEQESISIGGGLVLFLIAIRMIFPASAHATADGPEGEPFLVPLAVPLIAGPSTLAALLLFRSAPGTTTVSLLLAVTIAWVVVAVVLLSSTFFYRVLGERGLMAMERLMGMLLVMVAVQMFMNGARAFLAR
jgi:multiple antibiotic resistance protein